MFSIIISSPTQYIKMIQMLITTLHCNGGFTNIWLFSIYLECLLNIVMPECKINFDIIAKLENFGFEFIDKVFIQLFMESPIEFVLELQNTKSWDILKHEFLGIKWN